MALKTRIQFRRDTLAQWNSVNPVLLAGEIVLVNNGEGANGTKWTVRVGDGTSNFQNLPDMDYATLAGMQDALLSAKNYADGRVGGLLSSLQTGDTGDFWVNFASNARYADEAGRAGIADGLMVDGSEETRTAEDLFAQIDSKADSSSLTAYAVKSTVDGAVQYLSGQISSEAQTRATAVQGVLTTLGEVSSAITSDMSENYATTAQLNDYATQSYVDGTYATQYSLDSLTEGLQNGEIVPSRAYGTGEADWASEASIASRARSLYDEDSGEDERSAHEIFTELDAKATTAALDAVKTDVSSISSDLTSLQSSSAVQLSSLGRTGDTCKYRLYQGSSTVGDIEVPYDVFVKEGKVEKVGDKTYVMLTLNNSVSTVLSVETTDLVDIYTAQNATLANGGTVDVTVSNYKVSAGIVDGAITAAKLSASSVTTQKIADGNVTPAKMSTGDTFIFDCGGASL